MDSTVGPLRVSARPMVVTEEGIEHHAVGCFGEACSKTISI